MTEKANLSPVEAYQLRPVFIHPQQYRRRVLALGGRCAEPVGEQRPDVVAKPGLRRVPAQALLSQSRCASGWALGGCLTAVTRIKNRVGSQILVFILASLQAPSPPPAPRF